MTRIPGFTGSLLVCSLLALFSGSAFAATDYSVEATANSLQTGLEGVTRVPINTSVAFGARVIRTGGLPLGPVTVVFNVPGEVEYLTAYSGFSCSGRGPVRCVAQELNDPAAFVAHVQVRMTTAGSAAATVTLETPADENPANNTDTYVVDVVDQPSLAVGIGYSRSRLDPGQQLEFGVQVVNSGAPATNVVVTATLTEGGTVTGVTARGGTVSPTCTFTDSVVTCTAPRLPQAGYFGIDVKLTAPDRLDGGIIGADVRVTATEPDFDLADNTGRFETLMVRHILVTNGADEGAGSLRQALIDASVLCASGPCAIDFRIPGAGPFVIRPRTQLPDVLGSVKLDGRTQTLFGGDTNPNGPEILIDGSLQREGNGLVLRDGCEIQVLDLALQSFPNSAVEVRRGQFDQPGCSAQFTTIFPPTLIARNQIGTSNRGIYVADSGFVTIEENVLSDHRRSGLFAERTTYLAISRNVIERNGASGIFLDAGTRDYWAGGADVGGNVIAHNAQWGIARTRNGEIAVLGNSIFDNAFQGIDVDLDFDTPNGNDQGRPPNKPVLFSASYDAASNTTVVRGSFQSDNLGIASFTLEIYASRSLSGWGLPQGETRVLSQNHAPGDFALTVEGDLRGRLVTATLTRSHPIGLARGPEVRSDGHLYSVPADTSEFSNAVPVQ